MFDKAPSCNLKTVCFCVDFMFMTSSSGAQSMSKTILKLICVKMYALSKKDQAWTIPI